MNNVKVFTTTSRDKLEKMLNDSKFKIITDSLTTTTIKGNVSYSILYKVIAVSDDSRVGLYRGHHGEMVKRIHDEQVRRGCTFSGRGI